MSERLIMPAVFFERTMKPIFDALNWTAKTTEGSVQVYDGSTSVYLDSVVTYFNRKVPMERVENLLDVVMPNIRHKVSTEDVAPVPKVEQMDVLPTLEARVFLSHVLPFFETVGWTVQYELNKSGGVIVTGLLNGDGGQVAETLVAANVRQALPQGTPGPPEPEGEARPAVEGGFNHDWNSIDFSEIRKDPANVEYLEEYARVKLTVLSRSMLEVGKDGFQERGWIYTGSIRGQTIEIHSVLDKLNIVVPVWTVHDALCELGVDVVSAAEVDGDPVDMDLESAELPPLAERLIALDKEEAKRQAAAGRRPRSVVATEAEEDAELSDGRLVLGPEEKLLIYITYPYESRMAVIYLHIGSNQILVECSPAQAEKFLTDAGELLDGIQSAQQQNEEEKKSDGESREEDAQGADH